MQFAVIGLPRQGKSYCIAYKAIKEWVPGGRNVYTNFTLRSPADSAANVAVRPWPIFEDQMFFTNAVFVRDEAHVHFSAYRWKPNELEQAAIAMHAKNGNDVYYLSQAGSYLAKFLREICETFVFVRRYGPDGRGVINLNMRPNRGLILPWGMSVGRNIPVQFVLKYYYTVDLNENLEPRHGVRPWRREIVPFDLEVARSYRSDEIIVPQHLLAWKARLERTAPLRASLPAIEGDGMPYMDSSVLGLTDLGPDEQLAAEALMRQIYTGHQRETIRVDIAS